MYERLSKFYDTSHLTLLQRITLLQVAHQNCDHWWMDVLDCNESFCRKHIETSFQDAVRKYDGSRLTVIMRHDRDDDYLEIGFSTTTIPSFYLWVLVSEISGEAILRRFNVTKTYGEVNTP